MLIIFILFVMLFYSIFYALEKHAGQSKLEWFIRNDKKAFKSEACEKVALTVCFSWRGKKKTSSITHTNILCGGSRSNYHLHRNFFLPRRTLQPISVRVPVIFIICLTVGRFHATHRYVFGNDDEAVKMDENLDWSNIFFYCFEIIHNLQLV